MSFLYTGQSFYQQFNQFQCSKLFIVRFEVMSKEEILNSEKGQYPFQKASSFPCENTLFLVKFDEYYQNDAQYNVLKEKLNYRKKLQHPNLISFSHSLQEPGKIHSYFQYVHLQMNQIWAQSIGQKFFQKIKEQMIALAWYLRKNKVLFSFNPKNLGINDKMETKYFLGKYQIQQTDDGVSNGLIIGQIETFFSKLMNREKQIQQIQQKQIKEQEKQKRQLPTYKELQAKLEDRRKKSLEAMQKLKRSV